MILNLALQLGEVKGKKSYGWFQAAAIQGRNIFRDNVPEDATSTGLHIDHRRLQALQEKRLALGHRPDDHVEEQNMGGM